MAARHDEGCNEEQDYHVILCLIRTIKQSRRVGKGQRVSGYIYGRELAAKPPISVMKSYSGYRATTLQCLT